MSLVEIREAELRQHTTAETGTTQVIISSLYEQYYDGNVCYIFVHLNDQSEGKK